MTTYFVSVNEADILMIEQN